MAEEDAPWEPQTPAKHQQDSGRGRVAESNNGEMPGNKAIKLEFHCLFQYHNVTCKLDIIYCKIVESTIILWLNNKLQI